MMYEDMNEKPLHNEPSRERKNDEQVSRPVTDREVPLKHRQTPAAVHAWLDGDLPEAAVRRGDTSRDVAFWSALNKDMETRRRMTTPAHVFDTIMAALPQTAPMVITPWWRRPFEMTPMVAAAAATGLLAAGVVAATMFR
ncbi:MAG: hypothetical protein H0W30_20395 [Gemmatimonadaceae bacterium]|nr:hypothetical protein [Gemmatimonadaceae bacterium]MDQ3519533.1 hypothetical protein [Gemmatimonadota bacterium]